MKKIKYIVLAAILVLVVAGCSKKDEQTNNIKPNEIADETNATFEDGSTLENDEALGNDETLKENEEQVASDDFYSRATDMIDVDIMGKYKVTLPVNYICGIADEDLKDVLGRDMTIEKAIEDDVLNEDAGLPSGKKIKQVFVSDLLIGEFEPGVKDASLSFTYKLEGSEEHPDSIKNIADNLNTSLDPASPRYMEDLVIYTPFVTKEYNGANLTYGKLNSVIWQGRPDSAYSYAVINVLIDQGQGEVFYIYLYDLEGKYADTDTEEVVDMMLEKIEF